MGAHIVNGEFQSDKYPTCPQGKVPLSVKDPTAQGLLWEYAQRRRAEDAEFSEDLEAALIAAGFEPPAMRLHDTVQHTRTGRVGKITMLDGNNDIWVDHTGPYLQRDFALMVPRTPYGGAPG